LAPKTGFAENVLRLHMVGGKALVCEAALQKARPGKMPRAPRHEGQDDLEKEEEEEEEEQQQQQQEEEYEYRQDV